MLLDNKQVKEFLETALLKSVKQMGDPVLIGKQLDKAHRPKMEWSILLITAVLVVIAGIVQYLGVMSPITVTLPFISFGAASFILNMSL